MSKKYISVLLTGLAVVALTGCETGKPTRQDLIDNGHYWQRANVSEAAYMEGPKSQQMLNRDISRCVVELRELTSLHAIRHATPADTTPYGEVPDPKTPAGELAGWDTPERDGYLRAEHLEYHDFETCMQYKGWNRAEYLPYDVAERGRKEYLNRIHGEQYMTKTGQRKMAQQDESDFSDLNK